VTVYTEDESRTLRTAVFGAMVLVSTAEPGALDEESHAGIRAMARFSPRLRQVLGADRPELPEGSTADVEAGVLEALRRSVEIVAVRTPEEADAFPAAVLAICEEVASADGRVGAAESVVVGKVRGALEGR
jgi:tellurite resistance protein